MGMAASQARYLALVARKSNCEYEGQQINQARLALSNQSANLFNQMLGLKVPVPPSTQDYTKEQYSFTDGINNYTIDKWNQLAQPDSEGYNYVIDYHYKANVYTGSQKQMSDPQVQFTRPVTEISQDYTSSVIEIERALNAIKEAQSNYEVAVNEYNTLYAQSKTLSTYKDNYLYSRVSGYTYDPGSKIYQVTYGAKTEKLADGNTYYTYTGSNDVTYYSINGSNYGIKGNDNEFVPVNIIQNPAAVTHSDGEDKVIKYGDDTYTEYKATVGGTANQTVYKKDDGYYTMNNNGVLTQVADVTDAVVQQYSGAGASVVNIGDKEYTVHKDTDDNWYYKNDEKYYTLDPAEGLVFSNNVVDDIEQDNSTETFSPYIYGTLEDTNKAIDILVAADNTLTVNDFYTDTNGNLFIKKDLAALVDGQGHGTSTILPAYHITGAPTPEQKEEGQNWKSIEDVQAQLNIAKFNMETTQGILDNAKAYYKTLDVPDYIGNNQLTPLTELTDSQQSEIKQIIKDMTDLDVSTNLSKYFDTNTNEYLGGIYQFTLNGITYYTTYDDLANSILGGTGINNIDDQPKLPYYRADYVSQNITKQEKAVLETDSNGRFTSVRIGDDTVKYTLNVETITDDAAYEDAMNKYYYENAKYDKMVQDINAKTSIIQVEDRTLELRLKQLETEQNALSQEMEAVQKVVKNNVEKSFKTFGG